MFKKTLLYLGLLASLAAHAAGLPVKIGVDAEFGHKTSTSAQAVEQGIQIAIDEINQAGGVLGGRPLELVKRDNRAITAIGKDNLRELAALPDMVAVFGGKFSPVYVECLPVAHELGILLLDPWGSADLITDHTYRPSYTFRLSLKDAWAATALLRFAREERNASRVGVILPNTAWGRSNQAALAREAGRAGVTVVGERWYNWGDKSLIEVYQEVRKLGAQAVILAGGTHVTELCPELPVEPKKGHLLITDRYPGRISHTLVELGYVTSAHNATGPSTAANIQPRPTGQLFIGASRQFGTLDPEVEPWMLAKMLRRAVHYMPGLAQLKEFMSYQPTIIPVKNNSPRFTEVGNRAKIDFYGGSYVQSVMLSSNFEQALEQLDARWDKAKKRVK